MNFITNTPELRLFLHGIEITLLCVIVGFCAYVAFSNRRK